MGDDSFNKCLWCWTFLQECFYPVLSDLRLGFRAKIHVTQMGIDPLIVEEREALLSLFRIFKHDAAIF